MSDAANCTNVRNGRIRRALLCANRTASAMHYDPDVLRSIDIVDLLRIQTWHVCSCESYGTIKLDLRKGAANFG